MKPEHPTTLRQYVRRGVFRLGLPFGATMAFLLLRLPEFHLSGASWLSITTVVAADLVVGAGFGVLYGWGMWWFIGRRR